MALTRNAFDRTQLTTQLARANSSQCLTLQTAPTTTAIPDGVFSTLLDCGQRLHPVTGTLRTANANLDFDLKVFTAMPQTIR